MSKIKSVPVRKLYTGEEIPCIGMGTFGSDGFSAEKVSRAVYGAATEAGYRLFDCAAVYGNETFIGGVFEKIMQSGIGRNELFITSKVWNNMHGKGEVLLAAAKTLKDLRLDYLDICFVHWPFPNYHPPGCDVDSRSKDAKSFVIDDFMQAWKQMERLVDMGITRYIGMSNMTTAKLEAVLPLCRINPALIEMELHPCFQQKELCDYRIGKRIQPVGFCPIDSPTRPDRDKTIDDISDTQMPELIEIAKHIMYTLL